MGKRLAWVTIVSMGLISGVAAWALGKLVQESQKIPQPDVQDEAQVADAEGAVRYGRTSAV